MKTTVGLRFLLERSSFLNVITTEQEATLIVRNWMSGFFRIKDISIIGNENPPQGGWAWAVKVDQIQAIHVFDLQEVMQQKQGIPTPYNRSGSW